MSWEAVSRDTLWTTVGMYLIVSITTEWSSFTSGLLRLKSQVEKML